MQTWRSVLSLFLFFFTLNWQVSALPSPKAGDGGALAGIRPRSPLEIRVLPDVNQETHKKRDNIENRNVYDIILDVMVRIQNEVNAVKSYDRLTTEIVQHHVDIIAGHIAYIPAAFKAYRDVGVEVDLIFGYHSTYEIAVAIAALVNLVVDLVNHVYGTINVDLVAAIVAPIFQDFAVFLNVAVTVVVNLSVTLNGLGISAFISLSERVGVTISL
ncbi:hypothetical protein WG66_002403 [Moniliophthora roreri]|nr:hypothetical protein WG66_002403 [Moniliophthora roreri]